MNTLLVVGGGGPQGIATKLHTLKYGAPRRPELDKQKPTYRQTHTCRQTRTNALSLATQDERERERDGNFNCVYNLTLDYRVD